MLDLRTNNLGSTLLFKVKTSSSLLRPVFQWISYSSLAISNHHSINTHIHADCHFHLFIFFFSVVQFIKSLFTPRCHRFITRNWFLHQKDTNSFYLYEYGRVNRPIISKHSVYSVRSEMKSKAKAKPKTETKVCSLTSRHFHVHLIRIQLHARFIVIVIICSECTIHLYNFSIWSGDSSFA